MHLIRGGWPAFDWLINHCLGVVDWPLSRVGSVSTKLFCARRLRSGNPRCFLPPLPDWPSYWLRIGAQPSARVCDWSTAVSRPVIGGNTAMWAVFPFSTNSYLSAPLAIKPSGLIRAKATNLNKKGGTRLVVGTDDRVGGATSHSDLALT